MDKKKQGKSWRSKAGVQKRLKESMQPAENTGRRSFRESSMNRIRQKKTSRIQLRLVTETLQAMIRGLEYDFELITEAYNTLMGYHVRVKEEPPGKLAMFLKNSVSMKKDGPLLSLLCIIFWRQCLS